MKLELQLPGICAFLTTLPLDSGIENEHQSYLSDDLKNAAPKRKAEFIAGRYCIKMASKELGIQIESLPVDQDRSPEWPVGIIGSITHSNTLAIGCVGRVSQFRSIGIDTEEVLNKEIIENIKDTISVQTERDLISALDEDSQRLAYTVLFSGKESLFKALHPIFRVFIDFKDAQLTSLSLGMKTFKLSIAGASYEGTFFKRDDNIITAIAIN